MLTRTEVEAQLAIMPEPVDHQELIDQLCALTLLGKINYYEAKQATEDGDWERARRLIEEVQQESE